LPLSVCLAFTGFNQCFLKSFLKKKGVSQRGLANGLGITTNTIQRICKGERVTIKTAAQISNFLETVEADIFKPIQSKKQITKDMIPRLRSKRGFMEKAPLPGSLSRACPTAGRGSFGTGWRSRTRRSGEAGISSWIC
ncbi:helix-turn-helix transcriptional regulator, partial [uncultured Oscillibacter sp.]